MMALFVSVRVLFFKQKTAYELRISDWSSDVCSSDLAPRRTHCCACSAPVITSSSPTTPTAAPSASPCASTHQRACSSTPSTSPISTPSPRRGDRTSVVEGKSGSERVERGGGRIITKKK